MTARKRSSKRKKRIPNKYENTVCDLNKKKELLDEKMKESDQTRVSNENGETGEKVRSGSCNENNDEIGASGDEFRVNSVEISSDCDDCNSESGDVDSVKNHDTEDVMIEQIIVNGKVNSENGNEVGMDERFHAAEKDNTDVNDSQPKSYNVTKQNKATYAAMTSNNALCSRNLDYEPTLNEGDNEFVIFDEEMVNQGSLKWKFTVCGHFVGMKMSYNELKYNLVRMWSKFGLADMFSNDNEVYCFKFRNEDGMNAVLENSPWMVSGRPLIVQKWSLDVSLDKPEPNKIPLWVKMFDIPLEAWNKKGISKLASSLGKPLVMDEMTANMCQYGRGRIGFARVLVEVDAGKQFKEGIDVQYRDNNGNIVRTKKIRIEYAWKPPVCEFCKVFGHSHKICKKRPRSSEELEQMVNGKEEQQTKDKFTEIQRKKNQQNNMNKQNQQNNYGRSNFGVNIAGSRMTVNNEKFVYKPKENQKFDNQEKSNIGNQNTNHGKKNASEGKGNEGSGSVQSPNKFSALGEGMANKLGNRLNKEHKKDVDFFVDQGIQPTPGETSKWTQLMVTYFKERWEEKINKVLTDDDEEDVIEELNGKGIMENEIEGLEDGSTSVHQQ
ncbi:RNA-directed DNA polymerase, eukaryota, reverse transcriptase zinc-binding domain protein [Tanacetum coccineum]